MPIARYLDLARAARRLSGKSILSQWLEIYRLRKGQGKLGVSDYYGFAVYDADSQEAWRYVGWAGEVPLNDFFNHPEWAAFSIDKIVFYALCSAADIPIPEIVCIYSPEGRRLRGAVSAESRDALVTFLRSFEHYPLFAKPSHGNFGRGSLYLSAYDERSGAILDMDGTPTPLADFVDGLETELSGGYIFQRVFTPPSDVEKVCGARSTTIRVSMAAIKDGPEAVSAVWKLPTGRNIIDNFQHGKTGNLIASVDVSTGVVTRAVGGAEDGGLESIANHPETGERIVGHAIPGWDDVVVLCATAARQLPGFRLLHFDVALDHRGPLLLEVNHRGNLDLHQHASGRGFLSPAMERAFDAKKERDAVRRAIIARNDRAAGNSA